MPQLADLLATARLVFVAAMVFAGSVGCAPEDETGSCILTSDINEYCQPDTAQSSCDATNGTVQQGHKISARFDSGSCASLGYTDPCVSVTDGEVQPGISCKPFDVPGSGGSPGTGGDAATGGTQSTGGTSSGGTSSGGNSPGGTGGGSACTDDDASGDRDHGQGSDCDGSAIQFTGTLDQYDVDQHTFTMIDDGLCVYEPTLSVSLADAEFPVFNGAGPVCFSATCVNGGEDAITDCGPDASSTSDGCCATAGAFSYAFAPVIYCASGDYSVNMSLKLGKVSAGCGAEYTVDAAF